MHHTSWVHTPRELYDHLDTTHLINDEARLWRDMETDVHRFYPMDTDRRRVLSYIHPRLRSSFATWRGVGWVMTQAGLALPYTTYVQRVAHHGVYVVHTPNAYHRTSFRPDQQTLMYSITFDMIDSYTMKIRKRVVMHVAFGWSCEGHLGPCRVMVHDQLMLGLSPGVC